MQIPLDVVTERVGPGAQLRLVAVQVAWAAGVLVLCRLVQRRGERRLVVQGG